MSTMLHKPAVTQSQIELLARLVAQNRVTVEQLEEANVSEMSRSELARWIDAEILGTEAAEKVQSKVESLFAGRVTIGDSDEGAAHQEQRS